MSITHAKVSAKSDGGDSSLVLPSDWNDDHVIAGVNLFIGYMDPRKKRDEVGSGTSNRAWYYAFTVAAPVTVTQARLRVAGTSAGNLDIGVYSAALARLASTGSTASPGTYTYLTASLNVSVALVPGTKYYIAIATSDSTINLFADYAYGANVNDTTLYGYEDSAFPLPATASLTSGQVKPFFAELLA